MDAILDRLLEDVFQAEYDTEGVSTFREVLSLLKIIVQYHLNTAFDKTAVKRELSEIASFVDSNYTGDEDTFRELKVRVFHLFKNIYLLANGLGEGVYGMILTGPICYN